MLRLHGMNRADLMADAFPALPGRRQAELCAGTGAPADAGCGERLTERVGTIGV